VKSIIKTTQQVSYLLDEWRYSNVTVEFRAATTVAKGHTNDRETGRKAMNTNRKSRQVPSHLPPQRIYANQTANVTATALVDSGANASAVGQVAMSTIVHSDKREIKQLVGKRMRGNPVLSLTVSLNSL
jgi:hypothetical protein